MMSRYYALLLLMVLLLPGLIACGQKGPLYLPDDPDRREEQRSRPQP